jgi:hypothetical protein
MNANTTARNCRATADISEPLCAIHEGLTMVQQTDQKKRTGVISALGRQLKTLTGGAAKETMQPHDPGQQGHASCSAETAKPSTHQRVAIQNHRDDWP